MVRPHIMSMYGSMVTSSRTNSLQRIFVKMIPGFRNKSYEEGLRILRLNTLEDVRIEPI